MLLHFIDVVTNIDKYLDIEVRRGITVIHLLSDGTDTNQIRTHSDRRNSRDMVGDHLTYIHETTLKFLKKGNQGNGTKEYRQLCKRGEECAEARSSK
jgi:hypothetical protein